VRNVDNRESKCREEAGGHCENNDEGDEYNSFLFVEEKEIGFTTQKYRFIAVNTRV